MRTDKKSHQPLQVFHMAVYMAIETLASIWALFNFKQQL
jgi:hypothetical protein